MSDSPKSTTRNFTKKPIKRGSKQSNQRSSHVNLAELADHPGVKLEESKLALALDNIAQRKLLIAFMYVFMALCLSIILMMLFRDEYFFAVTNDGRQIPMIPLDAPSEQKGAIAGFVQRALPDCMTLGHRDYQKELDECYEKYFTARGEQQHKNAMKKLRLADYMEQEYALELSLNGARAVLVGGKEGEVIKGVRYFTVDYPGKMTFDPPGKGKNKEPIHNNWVIRVVVRRVETHKVGNDEGLGIDQFVVIPVEG